MRTTTLALALGVLTVAGMAAADPPDHSAGIGLRGAARDPTSLALAAKVKLFDLKLAESLETTLSLRPKLFVGSYLEARLPLTIEFALSSRVFPFIGVGEAFNTDDFGYVDHMFGFGTDVAVSEKLNLSLTCNLIYQRRVPDRDTELILTLNLAL